MLLAARKRLPVPDSNRGTDAGSHSASHLAAGNGSVPLLAALLALLGCPVTCLLGQVMVSGTVTDRQGNPVPEALIAIEEPAVSGTATTTRSNLEGAFGLSLESAGEYRLQVLHPEFFPIENRRVDLSIGLNIVNVELVEPSGDTVTLSVHARAPLATEAIAMSQTLDEDEIDTIPVTRSSKQRIQGVSAALPGIVRGPMGDVHFHGSATQETNWTLDGFSVTDPASGALEMTLGAESVRSLDLMAGRDSAEAGKGTGGAMLLQTRMGGDRFLQRFTNFVPGVDFERGLRISDWRPRHNLSGPVLRDRVWFFNGLDVLHQQNLIHELPTGQNRNSWWSVNNNLRLQAKLTQRQMLGIGFVVDHLADPRSGLSALDPMETTLNRRARRYFFNVRNQIALSPGSVLDLGYATYRSSYRGVPQGLEPYRITAFGRTGNYPIATIRTSGRDEVRANLFLPRDWLGKHQLKAGVSLGHSRYFQDVRRHPIEYLRVDGTRSGRLSFGGVGEFRESNLEAGSYVQDRWTLATGLVAEIGVRWDRDRIVSGGAVTPRVSLAFTPPPLERTRLSTGLSWIPSTTYFRIFTRHLDQSSIFTDFAADGMTALGPPSTRFFNLDPTVLTIPTTRNLSASWQQRLPGQTDLTVNYLRKRMANGYAHVRVPTATERERPGSSASRAVRLWLRNARRDEYDSVEVSLSRPLPGSQRWFASYTYARTWSNVAREVDTNDPVRFWETEGRLAWDIPHRLVSWASFPIGKRNSIACFAEWRDGFPFTVHDDNGRQAGPIHGRRLPRYFTLNVHLERELSLFGQRWSLRPGIDNVANRPNYSFANRNIDSPEFLSLFGRSPIKLVVRVRWLGRSRN